MEICVIPWVDQEKCVGCGVCISSCPENAILMEGDKANVSQDKCTFCGKCFSACPQEAIRPNSENPLLRGRNFHRPSGGRRLGR
ncbi:MAG: 4Fe-4S binding protein [Candidatus Thermoplasmatota archaeon]|nr:4Fe-4S binding protein [Candidatus Thermoplasmatota archaeon]